MVATNQKLLLPLKKSCAVALALLATQAFGRDGHAPRGLELLPKRFTFPPLSATKPLGWLRAQSRIQADTLGGHLEYFFVNN